MLISEFHFPKLRRNLINIGSTKSTMTNLRKTPFYLTAELFI